jgi:hypothetical protein
MIIRKTAVPRKKVGQKAAHRGAGRPSGQKAGLAVWDREIWRQRRTVPLSEFSVARPAPRRGHLTRLMQRFDNFAFVSGVLA